MIVKDEITGVEKGRHFGSSARDGEPKWQRCGILTGSMIRYHLNPLSTRDVQIIPQLIVKRLKVLNRHSLSSQRDKISYSDAP